MWICSAVFVLGKLQSAPVTQHAEGSMLPFFSEEPGHSPFWMFITGFHICLIKSVKNTIWMGFSFVLYFSLLLSSLVPLEFQPQFVSLCLQSHTAQTRASVCLFLRFSYHPGYVPTAIAVLAAKGTGDQPGQNCFSPLCTQQFCSDKFNLLFLNAKIPC